MKYLLDTCAVSEPWKPRPNAGYVAFLEANREEPFGLSVMTMGELRRGTQLLPISKRRSWLEAAQEAIRTSPNFTIFDLSLTYLDLWAQMMAGRTRKGQPLHTQDALIAATALINGLKLVTHNTKDFEGLGIEILNPWT